MKIAVCILKGFAAESDRIYTEHTQAEVQNQIEKSFVDTVQVGNNAAANGIETALARFLETMVLESLSREPADDVMSQCLERWSQTGTLTNAAVKPTVFNAFYIRSVVTCNKQTVD